MDTCRLVLLVSFLATCTALNSWEIPNGNLLDYLDPTQTTDWLRFKKEYNRTYTNSDEELKRRFIWEEAQRYVNEHNKKFEQGEFTFTLGENNFADLADDEVQKYYLSSLILPERTNEEYQPSIEEKEQVISRLPPSKNWVAEGKVTPVRNQGSCGSCWAFSAIGALESAVMIRRGGAPDLSEQQLVDCASRNWGNLGCQGGWMKNAYKYIQSFGGIDSESCYPYTARGGYCRAQKRCISARMSSYHEVARRREDMLQKAVAEQGPVAIAVDVNSPMFWRYRQGVFNNPSCSQTPVHAMVAVGYGTDRSGGPYWLVKNSYGARWGDRGYLKMARNRNNQCAIASFAIYPIVK